MSWNDERVDLLKKLWAEGLSASQVAGRIRGITGNAVIGKINRLGLAGRDRVSRMKSAPQKKQVRRTGKWSENGTNGRVPLRKSQWQQHLDTRPSEPSAAVVEAPIPLTQRRTILTVETGECRWPSGDPQEADFHLCGGKSLPGLSYCECHARRAFNTAPPSEKATPRRSPITNSFVGLRRSFVTEDA